MSTNYIAPIWRMPENANNTPVNKLSNYSMDFQTGGSAGRHIGCGTDLFTDSTIPSISISVWIKTSANGVIMSKDITTPLNRNFLFQIAGTQLYWQTSIDGTNFDSLIVPQSTFDVIDSEWHHIVVTYNAGTSSGDGEKKIYIDGSEIADSPLATYGEIYNTLTVPIEIGRRGDGDRYFYDNMSQVCIFDYALSSSQVSYLYGLDNPMVITGGEPVAYWPLGDNGNPNLPGSFPNISVGADSVFDFTPNDYINIPDNDSLSFGNGTDDSPFSVSAWVYFDTISSTRGIVGKYGTSDARREWLLYTAGATLRVYLKDSDQVGYRVRVGTTTLQANNWYHCAATYDGRGGDDAEQGVQIYINGQPETVTDLTSGTYVAMHNTVEPVNIGRYSGTAYLDGMVTNAQVWSTKLTTAEITTLYNNGQPLMTGTQPQESSLVAWWKLNQSATWTGSAWSVPDASTNSNTGTSVGMSTTNLVQSNLTRTQPYSNYSFNFDGATSDYFTIPNPGSIFAYGESALTFSGWINADSYTNQDGIFARYYGSDYRATIKLSLTSPYNGIAFLTADGPGTLAWRDWPGILTAGQWQHICVTYDAGTVKLYLDGVDQGPTGGSGTISNPMPNLSSFNSPLEIARDIQTSGRLLNGRTSNFCVFDRVLTEGEILNIYNNGVTQDLQATSTFSNNILAWWPMDEHSSYYDGTNWVIRDLEGGKDGNGINTGNVEDMVGSAPGSEASGVGSNFVIGYLEGNMKDSKLNAYSINMADYADGITNPANSGRSTDTP